jgi:SAM-dependent methyltransferase
MTMFNQNYLLKYFDIKNTAINSAREFMLHADKHLGENLVGEPELTYLIQVCRKISMLDFEKHFTHTNNIVHEIFSIYKNKAHDLCSSKINITVLPLYLVVELGPQYWENLMTSFPMQEYANSCADYLLEKKFTGETLLEVGAGVGNLSSLIANSGNFKKYIRTDREKRFLTKKWSKDEFIYDFNFEGQWREIDTIVGTNSLHCSQNCLQTIKYLFNMLKPGGSLVFSEGSPEVKKNEPWALNAIFSIYAGWFDTGGFKSTDEWIILLKLAGFEILFVDRFIIGEYDFGALFHAIKPALAIKSAGVT